MAVVSYSDAVLRQVRNLAAVAARLGILDAVSSALREMDERLRVDPESWGDPVYDYHGMRLTRYARRGRILTVEYVVYIDGTPVFVVNVEPRSGTPLDLAIG